MAVPGSVRSRASAGTNQLLAEGCPPVPRRHGRPRRPGAEHGHPRRRAPTRAAARRPRHAVLAAFDWEPATLEHLAVRTGSRLPELALALESLLAAGWVEAAGGWYERVAP